MAAELLILAFFAIIGVFLFKLLMGNPQNQMPPEIIQMPPTQQPYNPYGGQSPYPPKQGYYAPPKKRVIILPESVIKKRRKRRRKI